MYSSVVAQEEELWHKVCKHLYGCYPKYSFDIIVIAISRTAEANKLYSNFMLLN